MCATTHYTTVNISKWVTNVAMRTQHSRELWVRVDCLHRISLPTSLLQKLVALNLTWATMSVLRVYPVLPLDHHTWVPFAQNRLPSSHCDVHFSVRAEGI